MGVRDHWTLPGTELVIIDLVVPLGPGLGMSKGGGRGEGEGGGRKEEGGGSRWERGSGKATGHSQAPK